MPELPEVETIARALRDGGHLGPENADSPPLVGRTIVDIQLLWARTLAAPGPGEFSSRVRGQRIIDTGRRGKYLLLHLTEDVLLIHLRMSGDLIVESTDSPLGKHYRLVVGLDAGERLSFQDPRKFGRVWLLADPETVLGNLGPEPLADSFTADYLFEQLTRRRRQIKSLLLDQSFIAGMGNIYVDEALHRTGVHPLTLANSLSWDQAQRLWGAIRGVLQEGIRRQGASIDWVYRGGDFQNHFQVYRRAGEPCHRCQTPIERIVVGQRGTHFCPSCQPPPT